MDDQIPLSRSDSPVVLSPRRRSCFRSEMRRTLLHRKDLSLGSESVTGGALKAIETALPPLSSSDNRLAGQLRGPRPLKFTPHARLRVPVQGCPEGREMS